jgi:hypothetical protein
VINLDSLTRTEFNALFERICLYINIQGCFDPEAIDERMKKARQNNYHRLKEARSKALRRRLKKAIQNNRTLEERGFSHRVIEEAQINPRGKVALTLRYGLKRAKEILLRRRR